MKKNKFEFIIDSEFQSQIPALTDEEFQQLEYIFPKMLFLCIHHTNL